MKTQVERIKRLPFNYTNNGQLFKAFPAGCPGQHLSLKQIVAGAAPVQPAGTLARPQLRLGSCRKRL